MHVSSVHAQALIPLQSVSNVAGRQQRKTLRVQSAAMFESRFNSVERIMAYNQLAQEAPATIEATQCAVVTCLLDNSL